ncbi:hypothetical protein ABIE85_008237 [Bradyrhizobium diazoefficiens]|uniref:Uncharacterized protein n=3 Tax=Nitrobacteraceae TaxID=41294 RepID=A0A810CJW6_9BRAD|nr:hypothetical protein [Bradyrhizobium diazoefficiens]TWI59485.1 hypothetical protein IQ16_07940 [Bradyrhizobium huanghuaihaiense]WLA72424.1 hypothetical protein QIH77_36935 [Bradyrhizobium diazoefficiens]BCE89398.1 hypothetical protein XF10B_21960 [Bradyrhizobium diazoefficiens]
MSQWDSKAAFLNVPDDGWSFVGFANALPCHPSEAEAIARYLHRKRMIWLSMRAGHGRVFPAAMRPGRGRPKARGVEQPPLIDPQLAGFLTQAHPTFLKIRLLLSRDPGGAWNENQAVKAEINFAIAVEATNLMALCRTFAKEHPSIPIAALRDALWLDRPHTMPVVAQTQPDLAMAGSEQFVVQPVAKTRLSKNLTDEERMMSYIDAAGASGIAVYEIVNKGKIARDRVTQIGEMFENMGAIHSAVVRMSDRGRTGTRYFMRKYGEPVIGEGGRLLYCRDLAI